MAAPEFSPLTMLTELTKVSRNRRTTAQLFRDSLGFHGDFFERNRNL